MSTPEWLATSSLTELEESLAKINAKIAEMKAVDWTNRIAEAARRNQAKAHEFVQLERDALDDIRLREGLRLACEKRIEEVKEAEHKAKLQRFQDSHSDAILGMNQCLADILSDWGKVQDNIHRYINLRERANTSAMMEAREAGVPIGEVGSLPVPACAALETIYGEVVTISKQAAEAARGFVAPFYAPIRHGFRMVEITGEKSE